MTSQSGKVASIQPLRQPAAAHAQAATTELNGPELRQGELTSFFEKQEACTVVMEACGAKHYWAWVLTGLGYKVKLIAPEAVRLFVKKGKTETVAMLHTLLGQRTPDRLSKPTREHMEIQQ